MNHSSKFIFHGYFHEIIKYNFSELYDRSNNVLNKKFNKVSQVINLMKFGIQSDLN